MKKSKTSLDANEGIARVLTITSKGDIYEAGPSEISNGAAPSVAQGALSSVFTLEQSASPSFTVNNRGAAELYQSQMGGYMLLPKDGKVYAAKLKASDWDMFADGTPVTDASRFETMVHVPQCNFKAENATMWFSGLSPIDGGQSFDSPEWVGAYKMYVDSNNIGHSRPDVAPAHSRTMSAFQTCAQKLGSQWGQANYGFHCLINALYQARYGNLNSQEVIGAGFQHSNYQACRDVPMGLLRKLGDGSGRVLYNDDTIGNQYPVKLFGFEDLWGKLYEFRPGVRFFMDGSTRKAVIYHGNVVSNTAAGRMITVSDSSGYPSKMVLGEYWDMLPKAFGGSSSSYYCDYSYAQPTGELLYVGGDAANGAHCGVSFAHSNNAFSVSWAGVGARLAFYGRPIIVSGAELVAMLA